MWMTAENNIFFFKVHFYKITLYTQKEYAKLGSSCKFFFLFCIYLSLVRSGVMDCWTPVCSFVESSSEKDATQRQNNVV